MILTHRLYPFHGAVSVLQNGPGNFIRISTAKEGLFKGSSTILSVIPHPTAGVNEGTAFAKILWADALRPADRQKAHEDLLAWLDTMLTISGGEEPVEQLRQTVTLLGEKYRRSGMLKEIVNLLNQ